jgi:hypothetical protein
MLSPAEMTARKLAVEKAKTDIARAEDLLAGLAIATPAFADRVAEACDRLQSAFDHLRDALMGEES